MRWIDGLRTRLRLLLAPRSAERRMEEEIGFHIEMEAARLEREEGLEAVEARRRALVAFGGRDRYREEMRDGRGLAWLSGLRLDLKLGARMLLKHPVLTLSSVLALAVALALAASWFEFASNMASPRIPIAESDRLVLIQLRDAEAADRERRALHDFLIWRDELVSVDELSAVSVMEYSVTTEAGRFGTLTGARMTASGLRTARVRPLLGRLLVDADEEAGAEPVVVIGYTAWQRLFDGDGSVIGRTVRVGSGYATVVGVMPEGFGFPVNQELWAPLGERASSYGPREGPPITTFGRLAPGVTLEEARAELAVIGERIAAESPETHEHLRPEIRLFGPVTGEERFAALANIPFFLFLLVVSANVATLLFARTASREGEIAMRSALGASRRRLIVQLTAEALVLTSVAAALALLAADRGLRWGMDLFWEVQQMRPPFWWSSGLSATTVLYVAALAVVGAVVIGGVPGLRATRRQLRPRLTQPGSGGAGMRFGAVATGVIVVQVALCVAFIPIAIMSGRDLLEERVASDFPAEAFIAGRLTAEGVADTGRAELFDEAYRRLAAVPGVLAATRASRIPGFNHAADPMEIEADSTRILRSRAVAVEPDFFDVVGARIVNGRAFRPGDVTSEARVAVVDAGWAVTVFDGRNPVGLRLRHPARTDNDGHWYEIVGVVDGMRRAIGPGTAVSVYLPLRPDEHASIQLYLRAAGPPDALLPRVHSVVTSVDPALGVADLKTLAEVWRPVERSDAFFATALAIVAAIILLFALIGIYALMSFTVGQRAREIGIRAALGADPRRIIVTIFSRAMTQIGLGVLGGAILVSLTVADDPQGRLLVALVAVAMVAVGLVGCALPARRALRIQPTEALRAE